MDGDSPVAIRDGGLAHGACNNSCLSPLFNGVACAGYQSDGVKTDS